MPKPKLICTRLLPLLVLMAQAQLRGDVHIEGIDVGFGPASQEMGNYKVGKWAPARVLIRTENEGFDGVLIVGASDSDDVEASYHRQLHLEPNETVPVLTFVKAGKLLPDVSVRLVGQDGRTKKLRKFETATGKLPDPAEVHANLIVTVGGPTGLNEREFGDRRGYLPDDFRIGKLGSAADLPPRWFAYEAIDRLVLCISRPDLVEEMDVAAQSALQTWVRSGGHLVISVGGLAPQLRNTFLGQMIPGDFEEMVNVDQMKELEIYLDSSEPLRIEDTVAIPKYGNIRGRVLVGRDDLPYVFRGPYGLGMVTVVTLEADKSPFAVWRQRYDFWLKVFDFQTHAYENDNDTSVARTATTDQSSRLRSLLEQFQGVSLVPFPLVALFIFLYIVLIGPVDYLLVKKVFKRMELTWVTFPAMVIGVSVAAYFAAYWLKGDKLRVNKVDVVDLDQATGNMRGTNWYTLFSPQIKDYTLEVNPTFGAISKGRVGGGSPIVLSWLGLAEDGVGGMGRRGGIGMFRQGYHFDTDARRLLEVPVQVWSMKGFTGRWIGQSDAIIEATLESSGLDDIHGELRNTMDSALLECVLVYRKKVFDIKTLSAGASVSIDSLKHEDLDGFLRRIQYGSGQRGFNPAGGIAESTKTMNIVRSMMFYREIPQGDQASSDYFRDLDLSEHLAMGRAILVGRSTKSLSTLKLNDRQASENLLEQSILRVVLPVRSSGRDPFEIMRERLNREEN